MAYQLKNIFPTCLAAIAIIAVLSSSIPCSAQEADAKHSATQAGSRADDSTASGAPETEAGPADPAPTRGTPPGGGGQSGVAGLAGRVSSFNRNGPTRETWTTIDLGTKYVKAVVGGFEQGAVRW